MAESEAKVLTPPSEILSGTAIPFRFELAFNSLTSSLRPTPTDADGDRAARTLAKLGDRSAEVVSRSEEAREWELTLPRMQRTVLPTGIDSQAPELESPLDVPRFAASSEAPSARTRKLLVAAAMTVALSAGAYQLIRPETSLGKEQVNVQQDSGIKVGGDDWSTADAADLAGSARSRRLSLYRPSAAMSDYTFEFLGHIDRHSIGWVFRAADPSNYYAAQIETVEPGAPKLAITRFAVVLGVEGPHYQRPLPPAVSPKAVLKVKLLAHGPKFKIWVQDQIVEDWDDAQLKTGAVGFFYQRDAVGRIGSLAISFFQGGTPR